MRTEDHLARSSLRRDTARSSRAGIRINCAQIRSMRLRLQSGRHRVRSPDIIDFLLGAGERRGVLSSPTECIARCYGRVFPPLPFLPPLPPSLRNILETTKDDTMRDEKSLVSRAFAERTLPRARRRGALSLSFFFFLCMCGRIFLNSTGNHRCSFESAPPILSLNDT